MQGGQKQLFLYSGGRLLQPRCGGHEEVYAVACSLELLSCISLTD